MSLSASVGTQIPTNVVEVGNEISQNSINAIAASSSPSTINPMMTASAVAATYAPKASPTFTGTVTIPAGASISGYLTTSSASATYQTQAGMTSYLTTSSASALYQTISGMSSYLTTANAANAYASKFDPPTGSYPAVYDVPNDGVEYVRKNQSWVTATGGGGGGLTISTLSNAATSTLNSTAPTTGQALTFDGTDLVWATVGGGGGGGVSWGSITGTLSTQTDLQTALDGKLSPKTVNTVTSGTYTVQLSDANKVVYLASGGMGFQVQVDNDSSIAYVDGTEITIVVDNPSYGYTVIAGPGPVTVNSSSSGTLTNFVSNLVKVAANTWFVS